MRDSATHLSSRASVSDPDNGVSRGSAGRVPGLASVFFGLLRRDLLVTVRRRQQWLNPVLFFVMVVSLFPLGLGPEADTLREIAPGVIWVAALLATLLSLDMLFTADQLDGTLEQLAMSPQPLSWLVLAKVFAHWLVSGLPLVLLSPLLAILMQLPVSTSPVLMLSLALGTLSLSLIGAIGAALTVSLRHAGLLLSLLVLPLFVPVLIFGSHAVSSSAAGLAVDAQLSLLGAICAASLALAPWAIAAALRVGLSVD